MSLIYDTIDDYIKPRIFEPFKEQRFYITDRTIEQSKKTTVCVGDYTHNQTQKEKENEL